MKKLKQLALGVIGAGLLTAGLFACSNDEVNKTEKNLETGVFAKTQANLKVGHIVDNTVVPSFDINSFKSYFLEYDILEEIESVEVNESYLTVIGKDKGNFNLIALQFNLEKIDTELYLVVDDHPLQVLSTHSCGGDSCTSCDFEKDKKGKIQGCKCKGNGHCNHTVSDEEGNVWGTLEKAATVVAAVVAVIALCLS